MKPLTKRTLALPAVAAVVASTLSIGAPAAATEQTFTPTCVEDPTALGVEEALVYEPAPRELLSASGLDRVATDFAAELCSLTGTDGLSALVEERARGLWQKGILAARAMGADGELDADDRPLYWARLAMTGALRQWSAANDVPQKTLEAELAKLDALSRGQDTLDPDASERDVVVLTGFDPFFLNRDARISNPSGAIVLALDGEIVQGPNGPVEIQAALFPVRWRDFGDGMVEKALTPAFSAKNRPQLFFTISQGSPKSFDLEAFNGAWRGGTVDNEQVCSQGTTPIPAGVATVSPQPQWTESTCQAGHGRRRDGSRSPSTTAVPWSNSPPVPRASLRARAAPRIARSMREQSVKTARAKGPLREPAAGAPTCRTRSPTGPPCCATRWARRTCPEATCTLRCSKAFRTPRRR